MSKQKKEAKKVDTEEGKKFLIVRIFELFVRVAVFSVILSVLIEWFLIVFIYPESGAQHSLNVYLSEVEYMKNDFDNDHSGFGFTPYTIMQFFTDSMSSFIFRLFEWFNLGANLGGDGFFTLLDDLILSVVFVLSILILRSVVLLLSFPIFLFVIINALSIGVTKREIRKANLGAESSRRFNLAKRMIMPSMSWPWFIYLTSPTVMHPLYVILPTSILLYVSIRYASEYFEKVF
ncbi:integrating conjugative element membrane protein, PFL_4697 family [Vibrio xiamenensis]|uniref:Integrating conjugative element membrane protein, PFL_4697 family n=1 Tax=Vibrio xiamenensis TaxID=861298 RepID=A0A1G8FFI7_9VIBR|nr:DUF4400 domain-containing protein [Vibrio xiamenensis]SDH80802.1 integrating conjugative element membrane protein, PFL_4697 family [Vibrio xiamenensis]